MKFHCYSDAIARRGHLDVIRDLARKSRIPVFIENKMSEGINIFLAAAAKTHWPFPPR